MESYLFQFKNLLGSKTAKNTSVVFIGNGVSSVLAIIFTILAARALGPEGWGIVAAVGGVTGIMVALGEVGLDAALLRFIPSLETDKKFKLAKNFINFIFSLRLVMVGVFTLLLIVFAGPFTELVYKSQNTSLGYFTALSLAGALLIDFQIASIEAKQNWGKAAVFISLTNIIRLTSLMFVLSTSTPTLANILLIFTGSTVLAFFLSLALSPVMPSLAKGKKIFKMIVGFSGWMGGNKIVSAANSRLDVLLLIQLTGAYETGIYAAANRLAMGVPLIVASFATVLAPSFSSISKKSELISYFKKTIALSGLLVIGLLFGLFLAPYIISLFGEEYARSTGVLQILLVAFIPFILGIPAVNILIYAFKKPHIIATISLLQLPLIIGLNLVLIPKYSFLGPAIVLGIMNTLTTAVAYIYTYKSFKK